MDKRIAILLIIIGMLLVGIGYTISQQDNASDVNNTTAINNTINNTTVKNATLEQSSQKTVSGKYGYCAICGKALTYEESQDEYTQGKVCYDCASNPYYESGPGADYANQKLKEAYPEEYEGMFEEPSDDYGYYEYEEYDYEDFDYGGDY